LFGEQLVAVDDGGGKVDEFAVAGAGGLALQVEGAALYGHDFGRAHSR
jgi:hypothetical protein